MPRPLLQKGQQQLFGPWTSFSGPFIRAREAVKKNNESDVILPQFQTKKELLTLFHFIFYFFGGRF
jgi:hypothetical protein